MSAKQEWIDELWKVAQRELATGFLLPYTE